MEWEGCPSWPITSQERLSLRGQQESEIWEEFLAELSKNQNLEASLQKINVTGSLLSSIIRATHTIIARDDRKVLASLLGGRVQLSLTRLYKHLFQSTHQHVTVVTPNYDRLAEYAANVAGYSHYSAFSSGHLGVFVDGRTPNTQQRTVEVWKVHGSIDWFEDHQQQPICVHDIETAAALLPLIVTPGYSKYERALQEPFRTILAAADSALSEASSYLCVGFGFRDAHIEPKLVRRLRQQNTPMMIIAKTLTAEAKHFISTHLQRDYVALEEAGSGSRVYSPSHRDGLEVDAPNLWTLDSVLDIALGRDN